MNYEYLTKYLPKNKHDYKSIVRLCELTDEEFLVISDELLTWIQDSNWPIAHGMSVFLISKQDLIIDKIARLLVPDENDDIWKANIISELIPYFSLENQDKVIHLVERICIAPTAGEKIEGAAENATETVIRYRKRKELCTNSNDCLRNLYTVSDADVRYAVREILKAFFKYHEWAGAKVLLLAKQDVVVEDIKAAYYSDEYSQEEKKWFFDNLIILLTKENQEKILGRH